MSVLVSRPEDMSPDGKLTLLLQTDGDVIVIVKGKDTLGLRPSEASVEFCASGGRSPRTLRALRQLLEAMRMDNDED